MQAIVDQYHPTDERPTVTKVRFAAEPTTRDDRNDDHLFNDADVSAVLLLTMAVCCTVKEWLALVYAFILDTHFTLPPLLFII